MNTYLLLKSLHILGVVLFLGNIIITGWWKVMADRTKNKHIIAFAQRQVTLTDYVFTLGGVLLVLVTGIGNTMLHELDYFMIKWLAWGYWLFVASGIIWVAILLPVQIKQARIAKQFSEEEPIPKQYWKLGKLWIVFGVLATLLPLANLYWMVFKPI
ncbi:integral membrane protein-like protein [Bathymodiolus heckerae thiotrophic gill symbiont]|uniref:DUF2269 family protein n=1 Tax=Bathymodiolus heckerae thiotrophic gill symbiont TaxID=1052212 RepID=UPI0010B7A5B4|nr:DUF2269 family protein [Bathymodiolus heckerae thiotrophic gill symbiont]CAC9950727.1 integral membrane protein-like protein [uncultured Gammaproteobacteria bacterium]SMN14419.1 hypothetical protein CRYPD_1155 [uncultured Candidatus Thioglobus sp.]SHN93749.1 integral membrane protein-like protein [Bathymodiolus heckerae thiotrophic gill symbiont]SHN93788.1 integral membrane protein-like protein [Bathymodiolus heckerae thiotrophic gill symbiont]SMN12735.1 hypothetical protein BHECKSOX2_889 [